MTTSNTEQARLTKMLVFWTSVTACGVLLAIAMFLAVIGSQLRDTRDAVRDTSDAVRDASDAVRNLRGPRASEHVLLVHNRDGTAKCFCNELPGLLTRFSTDGSTTDVESCTCAPGSKVAP